MVVVSNSIEETPLEVLDTNGEIETVMTVLVSEK
jgi:hypothetical protein